MKETKKQITSDKNCELDSKTQDALNAIDFFIQEKTKELHQMTSMQN